MIKMDGREPLRLRKKPGSGTLGILLCHLFTWSWHPIGEIMHALNHGTCILRDHVVDVVVVDPEEVAPSL